MAPSMQWNWLTFPTKEEATRTTSAFADWKRWGPYLSERQWATVREDYSETGDSWGYFPHDHARSRAYRWGEDGLLGITDRGCRLCFALALWNEKDPILKERLFGLTNPEGNHGEDVKEQYFYLDATPTYSYAKALYKYPQAAFAAYHLVSQPVVLGTYGRRRNYETVYYTGRKSPFAQPSDAGPLLPACRVRSGWPTSETAFH